MTVWWCERCHASGLEDFEGLGVYDAVYQLDAAHDAHMLARFVHCLFNTSTVRVQEAHELPLAVAAVGSGRGKLHGPPTRDKDE